MPLPDITQVIDPQTVAEAAAERVEAQTVVREFFMNPPGGIPDGAGEWERRLQRDLVPLPIDQRYGEGEMGYISELIHSFFR